MISLVNNCPRLYHLDLSGCFQITNAIFEAFKEGSSVDNENIVVELYLGGNVFNKSESIFTGPPSTVGNVSGCRCVLDCRSRGREFDPGPVPYFPGD